MTPRSSWRIAILGTALHLGVRARAQAGAAPAPVLTIERAPARPSGPDEPSAPARPPRPALPTCEEARARYIEDSDRSAPPDLSAGAYGAVLNKGRYLTPCGVPASMAVHICAAVQNGHAIGVTVKTAPVDDAVATCIADAVRGMAFPSHPRLDVTTTTFAAN